MKTFEEQYLNLMSRVLSDGEWRKAGRTGLRMKSLPLESFKMDLRHDFPLLASRRIPFKSAMVELEGFIKGINSKLWYQARGCHFWDYWANPATLPEREVLGKTLTTKEKQKLSNDLGEFYARQWVDFKDPRSPWGIGSNGLKGINQLAELVDKIKNKQYDRRWKVSAWNPLAFDQMALVPCHTDFLCYMSGDEQYLDMEVNMRSNDLPLGCPNNIAFYAVLLMLLANEGGFTPRYLKHNMTDAHIYEDQIDMAEKHVKYLDYIQPSQSEVGRLFPTVSVNIETDRFYGLFDWNHKLVTLKNYEPMPPSKQRGLVPIKYPPPAV